MRIVPAGLGRARRRWADASIVVKGQLIVALPVLALATSSALVVHASSQRNHASQQREAAEKIDYSVGHVRTVSREAATVATRYLGTRDAQTLSTLERARTAWDHAIEAVEAAALAEPDTTLQGQVRELRAASDGLRKITDELVATSPADPRVQALYTRAGTANTRFEAAIQAISERASERARDYADAYDASSETVNRFVVVSALLGAVGAAAAMILLGLALRRRVGQLQADSEALGEGRPLRHVVHSADELGRLGRGLQDAARLLQDRERALHEAAETVRRSEQRLSLALESGAMATWDVDMVSGVAVWGAQAELDHGLEPGSFGGTFESWLGLVHPDDRAAVMAAGSDAMANGGRWSTEYRTVLPDGTVRWIGTSGQALLGDEGTPVRLVGVSIDITERKSSEEKLRGAIAEAERANAAKNEFLSRVSHELRTPLNAILGFGQLLELDELTEDQQESVGQVLRGGRHLLALIDDVLDISRIESGNLPLSVEPTAVAEVVSETLSLVAGAAERNDVDIRVEWATSSDVHVRADRRRLKQILVNLASNAVKYNRPGGKVTFVCSSPEPGTVRIAVRDTGDGISADRLKRLFTPFDRLGAEQTAVDGTGIGLALSQRLAEMMDTTLTVESEVGQGATFSIDLPAAADPATRAEAHVTGRLDIAEDAPGGTVLYVEDNPSNLKLVQRLLERRGGIRLLSAASGSMALGLVAHVPVDLVLLDLHLPDMSGAEILRRLRQDPATSSTPVVVVSADATPGQMERLRASGADGFLAKPFDLAEFLETIDGHLTAVTAR